NHAPDAWITTKTKIGLITADNAGGVHVHVDTFNGIVFLHGKVESNVTGDRAALIATKIENVHEVRNLIQVVPPSKEKAVEASDDRIKVSLGNLFKNDRALADSKIEVKAVNQGAVLLSGSAASLSDLLRV